jgi:CBS domain-containing protein
MNAVNTIETYTVRDMMSRELVTTTPETTLIEVVDCMRMHRVRALPVVTGGNRLVGVVSEGDLFLKRKAVPFSSERIPSLLGELVDMGQIRRIARCRTMRVEEVMTRKVTTITEGTSLEDAAMLMSDRRLPILPVVDSAGTLVGIVRRIHVLSQIYRLEPGVEEPAQPAPLETVYF